MTSPLAFPPAFLLNIAILRCRLLACGKGLVTLNFQLLSFLCFKTFCQKIQSKLTLFISPLFRFTTVMFHFYGPKIKTRNWIDAWPEYVFDCEFKMIQWQWFQIFQGKLNQSWIIFTTFYWHLSKIFVEKRRYLNTEIAMQ